MNKKITKRVVCTVHNLYMYMLLFGVQIQNYYKVFKNEDQVLRLIYFLSVMC